MKWTYAKNLKAMPKKSGRYLMMNELGTFFVGIWDAHDRKLRVQCLCLGQSSKNNYLCVTTGEVKMVRWDWKTSGHVYWADINDLDFYKIQQEALNSPK